MSSKSSGVEQERLKKTIDGPDTNPWRFKFPNTADFNFNFWKLLDDARGTAIARAPKDADELTIAVVGAGVAGLTVARELFRCGYKNIDIYEATDRIGGRTYSVPTPLPDGTTTFELGAMRLPFFWPYDEGLKPQGTGVGSENCVLDYYCKEFGITAESFPSPGVNVKTGIYIHRGYGPDPKVESKENAPDPKLLIWNPGDDPPDAMLRNINCKWVTFKKAFQQQCREVYSSTSDWSEFWKCIVKEFGDISFRAFTLKKAVSKPKIGKFGGLGMSREESRIFAVVGMGDGGWGAFYDISCLYVLRTMLFGFTDDLQLIKGTEKTAFAHKNVPTDSFGQPLAQPEFLGIQSLAESLFYFPADPYCEESQHRESQHKESLYDAVGKSRKELGGVHLYTRSPVQRVCLEGWEEFKRKDWGRGNVRLRVSCDRINKQYNAVILTASPWSLEAEATFDNFPAIALPWPVRDATNFSHFITSCKVFYPLKERYWDPDGNEAIPQVIVTDTILQGIYGVAVSEDKRNNPGVLLVSYTWEDDATKLSADDEDELARRCLEYLDSVLERCRMRKISPYVNTSAPKVWRWERMPSYRGCARLYRPGSMEDDYALLKYNEESSKHSQLYLAGEAYSVEGGWVEPALRSALDAVLYFIHNSGGEFTNKEFSFERDYPKKVDIRFES